MWSIDWSNLDPVEYLLTKLNSYNVGNRRVTYSPSFPCPWRKDTVTDIFFLTFLANWIDSSALSKRGETLDDAVAIWLLIKFDFEVINHSTLCSMINNPKIIINLNQSLYISKVRVNLEFYEKSNDIKSSIASSNKHVIYVSGIHTI